MQIENWHVTYVVICMGIGMVLCGVSFLVEQIEINKQREMFRLWETLALMDEKKARDSEAAMEQPPTQ